MMLRDSETNALYLGEIAGHHLFMMVPESGALYGVALSELGPVCAGSMGSLHAGMPVCVRVSRNGKRLLNWRFRGQGEPGFSWQEYMERWGFTYETRDRRIDVAPLIAALGIDEHNMKSVYAGHKARSIETGTSRPTTAREGTNQGEKQ